MYELIEEEIVHYKKKELKLVEDCILENLENCEKIIRNFNAFDQGESHAQFDLDDIYTLMQNLEGILSKVGDNYNYHYFISGRPYLAQIVEKALRGDLNTRKTPSKFDQSKKIGLVLLGLSLSGVTPRQCCTLISHLMFRNKISLTDVEELRKLLSYWKNKTNYKNLSEFMSYECFEIGFFLDSLRFDLEKPSKNSQYKKHYQEYVLFRKKLDLYLFYRCNENHSI